jgi:hypothetical protein
MTDGYGKENSAIYWKMRHKLLEVRRKRAYALLNNAAGLIKNTGGAIEVKLRDIINEAKEELNK